MWQYSIQYWLFLSLLQPILKYQKWVRFFLGIVLTYPTGRCYWHHLENVLQDIFAPIQLTKNKNVQKILLRLSFWIFLRQFHDDHIWRKCSKKILRQKWLSLTAVATCMIIFTFHKFHFCSNFIPLSLPSSWSSNTICWPLIDITHCTFDCNGSTFRQRMIPQCLEQHRR